MRHEHIGILGGMGPAAGLYFTQQLIDLNTAASQDCEHPSFTLYSNPAIPSRVDAYLNNQPSPAHAIARSFDKLAALGADFGVMICNTAHIYFDEIRHQVSLPLISMVDNTVRHVAAQATGTRIGLLATSATAQSNLYPRAFQHSGIGIAVPDEADQALLSSAIFDPHFGIKATGTIVSPRAHEIILEVARRLRARHGVQHLLLACTELSMSVPADRWEGFDVIDPVKLLALACLRRAGYQVRSTATRLVA